MLTVDYLLRRKGFDRTEGVLYSNNNFISHKRVTRECINQSINQSIKPLTVNDQWLTINIKIG